MKTEYNGYKLRQQTKNGRHAFYAPDGSFVAGLSLKELDALHQLIECNDDTCPGFQAGYRLGHEHGMETEHRPLGVRA